MSGSMWLIPFLILGNVISSTSQSIRLVNGKNSCSGRVEIYYYSSWGTVCDDGWDLADAAVVCREMGCGDAVEAKAASYFGPSAGYVSKSSVTCSGDESTLSTCGFTKWFSYDNSNEAGVICNSLVRLVNGSNPCSGRVEVLQDGQWGTVCNDGWDWSDAAVVCKEMGCGEVFEQRSGGYFGQGSGPVWLSDVQCSYTDSTLRQCNLQGWGQNSCGHEKDAGVQCRPLVKLVNGTDPCSGRVEVFYDGRWGTVCDDGWDLSDAAVVCEELGCGNVIEARTAAYFGQGSGLVWLSDLQCATDSTLRSCNSQGWGKNTCGHEKDAGVSCQHIKVLLKIEVKAKLGVNPNDAGILKKLSEEMGKKLQINGNFSLKTQADGKVFQKKKGIVP